MIIPDYWDEHRETRTVTSQGRKHVSRFGWSDVSQQQAKNHAKSRLEEAFNQLEEGIEIELREHRVSYNGSDGMPIREEIVQFHGDSIVSRNIYGALCLNTPDVLFADIDFGENYENKFSTFWTWLLFLAGALQYNYAPNLIYNFSWNYLGVELQYFTYKYFNEINPGLLLAAFAFISWLVLLFVNKRYDLNDEEFFNRSISKNIQLIEDFSAKRPDWNLRVYRTHSGLRIIVLHDVFDPNAPEVSEFFEAVNCDPQYVRMCQIQNCFRARVSPKPWRMELDRLTGGIWPIKANKLEGRRQWVSEYDQLSEQYRTCRLEKDIGSNTENERCEKLRTIHDDYCKVEGLTLPLA